MTVANFLKGKSQGAREAIVVQNWEIIYLLRFYINKNFCKTNKFDSIQF